MAHLTSVTQVKAAIKPENPNETVIDPYCGKKILRSESRHMIFRADDTLYFCSKVCQTGFLQPVHKKKAI